MRKLITFIVVASFGLSTGLEAQNTIRANTAPMQGAIPQKGIQRPKAPTPPPAHKIHAPGRPGVGYEIIDSTYNWSGSSIPLSSWNLTTKFIDYVYDGNYNITSYVKDSLNGTAWVNEDRYFYSYNSNDSVATYVVQTWSGSAWVNFDSTTYTYNTSGNITLQLDERWTGSAWVNRDHFISGYTTSGNVDTNEYQTWVSGAWSDSTLEIWTYNTNNVVLTNAYDTGYLNNWTPNWLYTYVYNSSGLQTLYEYETYYGSAWVYVNETIFSYNSSNLQDSVLFLTGGGGSTWVNSGLDTYFYNTYNQEITELAQDWNSGIWENVQEFTYTYSTTTAPSSEPATVIFEAGPPLSYIDEEVYTYNIFGDDSTSIYLDWSGTAFDSSSRSFYYYNSLNQPTATLGQSYLSGVWVDEDSTSYTYNSFNKLTLQLSLTSNSGTWTNSYENVYTYNSNDSLIFSEYQIGLGGGGWLQQNYNTWEYNADNFLIGYSYVADESRDDSTYHYLNAASGIKSISGMRNNMLIYPNPNSGNFTIQSSVVSGQLSVEVYNMLGEKIYQTEISDFNSKSNIALDVPDGVYFIRVISEKQGQVMNGKIVVQR